MDHNISITNLSNPRVFEEIFNIHYVSLCGFAFHYLEDHDLSEEIVQEVLSNLWENAKKINVRTNIKSYLLGSVRNACLNYLKHQQVEMKYKQYVVQSKDYEDVDFLEIDELEQQIERTIASLPEKCREIFEMSRFGEKSYNEIATLLNISVKTVETQISRALKVMRKALGHYLSLIFFLFL